MDVFDPSDLESWDVIGKKNGNLRRLGRSEYFAEIRMLCYLVPLHTNTHTVRSRPTAKREIRRFRNRLVRERKVNERKLLRQSKTLCSNGRHQFVVKVKITQVTWRNVLQKEYV